MRATTDSLVSWKISNSWRMHGVSLSIRSSASMTAKGSFPTRSRAHSTAWPSPSGFFCRTETTSVISLILRSMSTISVCPRSARTCSSSGASSKWSSIPSLPRPVTKIISWIPASTASCTTYWIDGMSTMGKSSFGTVLVAGRNRVPKPATGMTAFRSFMKRSKPFLDDLPGFALFDLLAGLASNAERGDRTRLEPLDSDLFSTFFTDTVVAVIESPERFLNLEDQLTFTVANTQHRVSVRLHGCSVGRIWKISVFVHVFHSFAGFRTELLHPLVQKVSKEFKFLVSHFRLV